MKATNTTTKATTTETTNRNTFTDLLREYERQATTRTTATEKEYTTALTNLATAVAYSVLKKCIETSNNETLTRVKRDIARDTALLNNTQYAMLNAYEYRHNKDGEKVRYTKDKDLATALNKLCADTLGEGLDLVNIAIVTIMQETDKARERDGDTLTGEFMESRYTVRRLKRKVWIKTAESVKGWETVETSPIQETYKAVRREIQNSRAVQTDARNGYTYLEDYATDPESETETTIYRRLPKYTDLGGRVCDFNGKETAYTADTETVETVDRIIEDLNLSKQQADILKLRLSGYGRKAIATYLGVRDDNIKVQLNRIQAKAKAIGFQPTTTK